MCISFFGLVEKACIVHCLFEKKQPEKISLVTWHMPWTQFDGYFIHHRKHSDCLIKYWWLMMFFMDKKPQMRIDFIVP